MYHWMVKPVVTIQELPQALFFPFLLHIKSHWPGPHRGLLRRCQLPSVIGKRTGKEGKVPQGAAALGHLGRLAEAQGGGLRDQVRCSVLHTSYPLQQDLDNDR